MSYIKQTENTTPRRAAATLGVPGASLTRRELIGPPARAFAQPVRDEGSVFAPPRKLNSPGRARGLSASKIPTRPPVDPAFVLRDAPIVQHTRYANQAASAKHPPHSTPRSTDLSQRRIKAMQLGVFKITETELKERYSFMNEIGAGEWGSIWAVEAVKPLEHLPSRAYRLRHDPVTGAYTVDNSDQFQPLAVKLCKREGKFASAARTKRLWNEFKVLRTLMDQLPRAEQVNPNSPGLRVRNDSTGWHPSIVHFYEFVLTPTLAMLAMPKYDEPMKVCLPEPTCRVYFQQLLSAVHWLHQHCVCHNDIKVDNLLVTFDTSGLGRDTVTLVDFGFANRYDPALPNAFRSTDVWGTPEYLAPERIRGELHDERRSDIWALGIAFFEIYTGRTPFERHDERFNSKEKFEEYYQRAERGVWLGEWDLPAKSEDLIRKMLNVDADARIDAAGALLHAQFDPGLTSPRDSMDELLQLPYDDTFSSPSTDLANHDLPSAGDETGDTDDMFGEILAETEHLCLSLNESQSSLHASPGVGRAQGPVSPTLSQVGMDSRLTDLMAASPPWKRVHQTRHVPSSRRHQLFADESVVDDDPEPPQDRFDETFTSVEVLPTADDSGAVIATPTKCGPVAKPQTASHLPVASRTVLHATASSRQLFRARGAAGNTVASLAKRFDSSSLLPLPAAQVARIKTEAQAGVRGLGHKRSKSCTLPQEPTARRSIRHSTGAAHLDGVVGGNGMRARMLGKAGALDPAARGTHSSHTDSTVDSAVLRTLDVGESPPTLSRAPSAVSRVSAADTISPLRAAHHSPRRQRPASETSASAGGEVIVTKLKKMASLASLLTKMIDETKTTILSPSRLPFASPRARQASVGSSDTPAHAHEVADKHVSLVSASYSLDLSGVEKASLAQAAQTLGGTAVAPPSPSQVEGMYTSFLLSQNVSHVGSGYLSPTAAEAAQEPTAHRSLASLFVVPSSPTFTHLLEKYGEHPKRERKTSGLPQLTTSSLGMAAQPSPTPARSPPGVRQSVALENATFEILNPSRHTSDDTLPSASKYELVEAAVEPAWTLKPKGARSKLGRRLLRLVS